MPLTVARLRRWFALAAIFVALVVAGFYFYGRMRVNRAIERLNTKLGVDIQQTSEGFSLSHSEGGRTLFTIRAAKAIRYKEGDRAELKDVNIVVYGRTSNRFDQIYGSDFLYDPKSRNVIAKGVVHIDLQGYAEGAAQPDQAPPPELKNPIHLKTSGLTFNQDTGLAHTDQEIEFRIPQAGGTARGATYNSKLNTMALQSEVRIQVSGAEPADIAAASALISKEPRQAVLERVRVERKGGAMDADHVTLAFREDNSIDRLAALGNVRLSKPGPTTFLASAPRADVLMSERNALRSAALSGGVSIDATGQRPMQGRAGRVLLDFGPGNRVDKVHAVDNVRLVQQPAERRAGAQPQTIEVGADAMDFLVKNGEVIERADTAGAAQILLAQAATQTQPEARTVVTAGRFTAEFDQHNRLQAVTGTPNSRILWSSPGKPPRVSTANLLNVQFNPSGQIESMLQEGEFHFSEADRSAWAERALYTPADQMLLLTGSPRVVEAGMTTTANTIRMNRHTGDAIAQGNVKTTYSELKPQPGGALLATADPVHVTAQSMIAQRASRRAEYLGDARLWQGANIVQAPKIDFDREHRTIVALGGAGRVSTVFVQRAKNGKVTPVNVTSAGLNYTDAGRVAHFQGGVVLKGADAVVTADQVDVFLHPRAQGSSTTVVGPSQLDHIVAQGHIWIQEPNRQAKGEKLVYTAAEDKFVLTGGPPSIFDAEHGTTTGDSLTFFSRDDRVLVEGTTSPTVTQTRVAK